MRVHRGAALVTTAAALLMSLVTPGVAAQEATTDAASDARPVVGAEEALGNPIEGRVLSQEQSQGVDAEGRPQAYWVTAGNDDVPGMFQVTDLRSKEVVFAERLPAGAHSWASTFSTADGTVYFGMTSGEMYSWRPGDDAVTDYGKVPFDGEGVWRLAAAEDGTIYGGTYPGGILFEFDPSTEEYTSHGQAVPGETYARTLAVDADSVYVGTQPRAKLTRFDRATGAYEPIALPGAYDDHEVVYDMTRAGDYLLLRVQPSSDLLVYDVGTGEFVNIVEGISGRAISPVDPTGQYVYFRIAAVGVVAYDLGTHTYAPVGWAPNAFPGSWAWIDMADPEFPGLSLAMTYYYGRIYVWNPESRKGAYLGEEDLQGAPNLLTALSGGPDGAVYAGAFLSPPGMARFDPADDATTLLPGAGQVEGFGTYGDHLVYGRYPNGGLFDFDTTQPWSMGTNPGAAVVIGDEQDRPQAFARVGDLMAAGSVPKSGRLGGALSLWDPATGALSVHRDVVADQSVVSLAEDDGMIFGGTSINGGYGIDPAATEAEFFAYDPSAGAVVDTLVPVPGAHSVNALTVDDAGLLWGIADGTLFTVDPDTREVTRAEELFGHHQSMYGVDRGLVFHDGDLYAASSGRLWRVEPDTWEVTELARGGVGHLTQDASEHDLYYTRGAALFRWNFALEPEPVCDEQVTGTHTGPLHVTAGTTCLSGAEVFGPVTVAPGASLVATGSSITGPLRTVGAGLVELDTVTVTGPVSITHGIGATSITGSTVTGPLRCADNDPAPVDGGGNTVHGPASGQCAGFG